MSNKEVLKREEELLSEIEILKSRNKKLEKLVADIYVIASDTSEILSISKNCL